jgi:hypothetical protein
MHTNWLTIALLAAAFAARGAYAAGPHEYIGSPDDAVKQQEVQSAAVYSQEGATSGLRANELANKGETPPALSTEEQKEAAVEAADENGYPQKGAKAGLAADKDRAKAYASPPLVTNGEKQQAVEDATQAHADDH